MIGFKVVAIFIVICTVVSVEGFITKMICKIRWKNTDNWEDCMSRTNTTKADITPWVLIIPVIPKPRKCLRLCVQEQLCPPSGIKRVSFNLKKKINKCTYDETPPKKKEKVTTTAKPGTPEPCEELWKEEANWESCLIKTNTTKKDITPWKVETDLDTKQRCLRICVEEELCPPSGFRSLTFSINKRQHGCTFEEGPINDYNEKSDGKRISTTVGPVLTTPPAPTRRTTPKDEENASCETRWANEANWKSCMAKTNTTKKDITPWRVIVPIVSKPVNCLRLCVEQELCPPTGIEGIKFAVRKRVNHCTFDDEPLEPEATELPKMEDDKSASCKTRWTIESNWVSCMVKTDTDEGDITPWIVRKRIRSKARNCLRLCVQKELCPPSEKESKEKFDERMRVNECKFDEELLQLEDSVEGPSEVTEITDVSQGEETTLEDERNDYGERGLTAKDGNGYRRIIPRTKQDSRIEGGAKEDCGMERRTAPTPPPAPAQCPKCCTNCCPNCCQNC